MRYFLRDRRLAVMTIAIVAVVVYLVAR